MKNKTDEELVFEASRARSIDSASIEMMRRLKNSIEKLNESTKRYSNILISLTLVLVGIGVMQMVVSSSVYDRTAKIIAIFGILIFSAGLCLIFFNCLSLLIASLKKDSLREKLRKLIAWWAQGKK